MEGYCRQSTQKWKLRKCVEEDTADADTRISGELVYDLQVFIPTLYPRYTHAIERLS